jgi:hypothetical protein
MVYIINKVLQDIFGWTIPGEILRWILVLIIFLIPGIIIVIPFIYHLIISKLKGKGDNSIEIEGDNFILRGKSYIETVA